MSDYKLRKDIDKLLAFQGRVQDTLNDNNVNNLNELLELYPDISQLEMLNQHMIELSYNLNDLKDSLIDFNKELLEFNGDNTTFANHLSELKTNLSKVLNQLTEIKDGSSEFSSALDKFNIDIDEFVTTLMGLNTDLTVLSTYITNFEGDLNEFNTALTNAGIDTSEINDDIKKLVWAIGNVRNRTTVTEGNIATLRDDIGDATNYNPASGATPNGIQQWIKWIKYKVGDNNSGIIKSINDVEALIGDDTVGHETGIFADIVTANNHITTVTNKIFGTGGSENDLKSDGILYKINNTLASISDVNTDLFGKANGTVNDYTTTSIYGKYMALKNAVEDAQSDITTVQGDIGTVDKTTGDLSTQSSNNILMGNNLFRIYNFIPKVLVFNVNMSNQQNVIMSFIRNLFDNYISKTLYNETEFSYFYNYATDTIGKLNFNSSGKISSVSIVSNVDFSDYIGICYFLDHTVVKSKETYPVLYELRSNKFYVTDTNEENWVISTDITDYYEYLNLYFALGNYYAFRNHSNDVDEIVNVVYPVGAIYISVNSTNPHDIFGGTWEQIQGRFLIGAGTVVDSNMHRQTFSNGETDGAVSHTLSVSEMPAHSHTGAYDIHNAGSSSSTAGYEVGWDKHGGTKINNVSNTGGGQPHNNMPPYLVVYMWKRTA